MESDMEVKQTSQIFVAYLVSSRTLPFFIILNLDATLIYFSIGKLGCKLTYVTVKLVSYDEMGDRL